MPWLVSMRFRVLYLNKWEEDDRLYSLASIWTGHPCPGNIRQHRQRGQTLRSRHSRRATTQMWLKLSMVKIGLETKGGHIQNLENRLTLVE